MAPANEGQHYACDLGSQVCNTPCDGSACSESWDLSPFSTSTSLIQVKFSFVYRCGKSFGIYVYLYSGSSEYGDFMTDVHIQVLSQMEFNTWAPTHRNTVSSRGPQHEPLAKFVIVCVCVCVCVCARKQADIDIDLHVCTE